MQSWMQYLTGCPSDVNRSDHFRRLMNPISICIANLTLRGVNLRTLFQPKSERSQPFMGSSLLGVVIVIRETKKLGGDDVNRKVIHQCHPIPLAHITKMSINDPNIALFDCLHLSGLFIK